MADEISIYISPEDDITTVRERLEKTTNRQVTMVIPAQTQLRSLVAWRVLHADARRMGKDVLVVSTDPQIRSLAQAGKFRVAHSQAASISGKSRPPTRPGRTNAPKGRLTSSQARMQATKKPSVQLPPDQEDENEISPIENTPSRKKEPSSPSFGSSPASPTFYTTEQPFESSTTGSFRESNTFPTPLDAPQSGHIVDLHPESRTSAFRPNPNEEEEESNNQWADQFDIQQAADIRNFAQYSDSVATPPVGPSATPPPLRKEQQPFEPAQGAQYRTTPLPSESEKVEEVAPDYYSLMEDKIPHSPLAEQRGSAYANEFDADEQNVRERNAEPQDTFDDEFQVENLGEDAGGDVNMFDLPSIAQDTPHHVWSEPLEQEQPESTGPSRIYKNNAPRTSRRENRENPSPAAPRIDEPDALPPVEDQPTVTILPEELSAQRPNHNTGRPATQSRSLPPIDLPDTPPVPRQPGAKRASQQILGNTPRGAARPQTNVPQRTGTSGSQRRAAPRAAAPTRKLPSQSSRRSVAIIVSLVILLFLLTGLVALVIPTTDVTLKLPAKDYSHAVTLKAVSAGQQGSALNTVPADSLNNTFEATGTGRATSSAKVGTAPATGEVTFTNSANVLVTIPSGTIVTTSNGTAFSTQAEAVVNTPNSNVGPTIQVPIKAQTSGTSGNVPAGSINAIPPDSLNAIVMYNKMNSSDLKLTVTNEQPTASGGVGNTPAIAQKDIDATKASLDTILQGQFNTWLAQKTASGDKAGTLTSTETLENAPSVGQTTTDGTFTAKLRMSVTVLIVRAATLQRASIAQLNRYILADKNKTFVGYTVVDDAKLPVQVQNLKTSSDNKSTLTLIYTAAAKVVQSLDIQHLRGLIAGKSIADARKTLQSIPGVQHVDISTGPKLGGGTPSWISFLSSNITIHLIPEDNVTPPKKK